MRSHEHQILQPKRENTKEFWQITRWLVSFIYFHMKFFFDFSTSMWLCCACVCVCMCFYWNWKEVSANEPNVTLNIGKFSSSRLCKHIIQVKALTLRHYGQMSFGWRRVCALFVCLLYTVSTERGHTFHEIKRLYMNSNCHQMLIYTCANIFPVFPIFHFKNPSN